MPLLATSIVVMASSWPLALWSAQETVNSATPDAGSLVKMGLMLGVVLFMFIAFAWVMKRMTGMNPKGGENIKVSGGISLGQRERLVVVEIENQRLLLGVTSQNIQLVKELSSKDQSFSKTYQQAMPEKNS